MEGEKEEMGVVGMRVELLGRTRREDSHSP